MAGKSSLQGRATLGGGAVKITPDEQVTLCIGKRGKTGGGMNLQFTGGHELDSFWECCRPPTSMAYRTPI